MSEEKDLGCFEITHFDNRKHPFHSHVEAVFYRDKGLINIEPVFREFFSGLYGRDRGVGYDLFDEQKRVSKIRRGIKYYFSVGELAEAFLGTTSADNMGNFLERHLIKNEWGEEFINRIKTLEEENYIAFQFYGAKSSGISKVHFYPLNFPVKGMNDLIRLNIPKIDLPKKWYKPLSWNAHGFFCCTRRDIKHPKNERGISVPIYLDLDEDRSKIRSLSRLRRKLMEKDPIVIIPGVWSLPNPTEMDLFALIKNFNLDTSGLEVVRKTP